MDLFWLRVSSAIVIFIVGFFIMVSYGVLNGAVGLLLMLVGCAIVTVREKESEAQ